MISNYDENIRENAFFQRLLDEQYETVKWNYQKDLVICVPKASSLDPNTTARSDLLDYILISKNNNSYTSMNDDVATIEDEQLILGTNGDRKTIRILFDETFYEKNKIKYKVLCIESYIAPMDSHRSSSPNLITTTDCIDFLWCDINESNIVKKINTMARNFLAQQDDILELKSLSSLKEIFQKLYEDSLAVSIKHLSSKKCSKEISRIKIAVETCMQYCCENKIFEAVATYVAVKDSVLNKIIRNLQHVPLKDFSVNTQFYDHLVATKFELNKINKFYTVLEKVNCLKRTFELLSKNVGNVTASDFLQVLIYLLVKLQVNNWYANLYFLMHFHFSTSEESGQYNFLIASLEAAIEYIKSGNLQANSDPSPSNSSLQKLFDQISLGNLETVKSILNTEKNANETKLDLCHPLCSCDKCELTLSEFKEKNYCAINSVDDIGRTPLHTACIFGNPLIVEYLLQKTKDVDQVDYLGYTSSLYASSRGHQPALLLLLYSHANLNTSDNDGNTLLHLAANNGHEHCVKALLYYAELSGQPATVNASNNYGDTALHQAAKWGHTAIVNLLLQHNAIVGIQNRKKQTPLDIAHNYYVRQLLLHYSQMQHLPPNVPPKRSMSLDTCTPQDKVSTRPNNLDQYKKIDLLLASIEKNDIPLTCYYLGIPNPNHSEHVNPYICHPLCNCDKCSSSTSSTTPKNPNKSDSLNINVSNVDGYTALHIAAKYGRCEILRLLLDSGADVNVVARKSGYAPLHLACLNQRASVIRELIQCGGCRLDAKDNDGNTPLYYACVMEQVRIVEMLLQEGACIKIKNNVGRTVEDVSQEKMLLNVLKLLQKNY